MGISPTENKHSLCCKNGDFLRVFYLEISLFSYRFRWFSSKSLVPDFNVLPEISCRFLTQKNVENPYNSRYQPCKPFFEIQKILIFSSFLALFLIFVVTRDIVNSQGQFGLHFFARKQYYSREMTIFWTLKYSISFFRSSDFSKILEICPVNFIKRVKITNFAWYCEKNGHQKHSHDR